jgi:Mg2+/Co2+ transporter CorB
MTLNSALVVFAIIALLIVAAFLTAAETSLAAVSQARMHRLSSANTAEADRSLRWLAAPEQLNDALLFGHTVALVLATTLATSVALRLFTRDGVLVATLIMASLAFAVGHVLPKALAAARGERFALSTVSVLRWIVPLLAPVAGVLRWTVLRLAKPFAVPLDQPAPAITSHEEIRGAIELHHHEGGVEREHRDMLGGILDLARLQLADVMVHRKNMEVLDASAPAEAIVRHVLSSTHTRFPIWRDDPENIVGVLHLKVLVRTLMERQGSLSDLNIMGLAGEPWFVPDTTTLEEQLNAFRDRHEHFALVVDEYGVLQGLVTLEDIVEEVFGKISEGRQARSDTVRPRADGSFIADGLMPVRELNRQLRWTLPVDHATTIAGLVIHEARIIPDVGHVFSFYGFKFEVLRRQRNQITLLRIVPPPPPPEEFRDDTG